MRYGGTAEHRPREPRARTRLMCAGAILLTAVMVVACAPPPQPARPGNPLSLGRSGVSGDGASRTASLSANGRWVAFTSEASDLVPGDGDDVTDLFWADRGTGAVQRVRSDVSAAPRITHDGRWISYVTPAGHLGVIDRITGEATEWSPQGPSSIRPVVDPGGTTAVYGSSVGAFTGSCRVRELDSAVDTDCPSPGGGPVSYGGASANGRFVIYNWAGPTNGPGEQRIWDRVTGEIKVLDQQIPVFGSSLSISADGRHVASVGGPVPGSLLTPTVHDLHSGDETTLPGATPDAPVVPVEISADGRHVLLASEATNLVPGDTNAATDIFIWDLDHDSVRRISVAPDGAELTAGSFICGNDGQILADGSAGCFLSLQDLVAADTNGAVDPYLGSGSALVDRTAQQ